MSNTQSASQHAVDEFFRALSERDLSIASAVLTKEAVEIIPLAMAGGTDPEPVFDGKDAVLGYLQSHPRQLQAIRSGGSADVYHRRWGHRVCGGPRGLIMKQTGQPYRNIYVFRFSISDGKITEIREYANPIIYAKALGLKVG